MTRKTHLWDPYTTRPIYGTNQKEPRCPSEMVAKSLKLYNKYELFYGCSNRNTNKERERRYIAARYCLLTRLDDMSKFAAQRNQKALFARHKHVLNMLVDFMKSCSPLPTDLQTQIALLQIKNGKNPSKTSYNRILAILDRNRNFNVSERRLIRKRLF